VEEELDEPLLAEGWVADEVREEFPDLRLRATVVPRGSGKTPPEIRERLRLLSDRFRGAQAIVLRQAPIPSAYRVFFRHVGLDPDTTRTPVEEAAVQRLVHGGFKATNLLDGRLAVYDAAGPVATLFGEIGPGRGVTKETARMLVYTVQVPGVPAIFVDEAMWTCVGVLQDGR
jgi:DNA/RNA-binding domain of Phe-tRNA-synthetase-like protein